jgi:uncharacterized RDD family membrane protein YckC
MKIEENLQQSEHLFTEEDIFQFQDASSGQRFLNFLIDSVVIRYTLYYGFAYLFWIALAAIDMEYTTWLVQNLNQFALLGLGYFVGCLSYLTYYTFCEKVFRGYSLGKILTGTRTIRQDGQELKFKDAFFRSLCRLVPFEPLSGFGYPWHDRWTKTMVIKSR